MFDFLRFKISFFQVDELLQRRRHCPAALQHHPHAQVAGLRLPLGLSLLLGSNEAGKERGDEDNQGTAKSNHFLL